MACTLWNSTLSSNNLKYTIKKHVTFCCPLIQNKIIFPLQLIFRSVERKEVSFLNVLYWSNFSLCFVGRFSLAFYFCTNFIWGFFLSKVATFLLLCSQCRFNCKWFMSEYEDIVSHLRNFSFVSVFSLAPSNNDLGLYHFFYSFHS